MLVGFTITNFNGKEEETLAFLKEICVVSRPGLLEGIVASGPGVHIYPTGIITEELLNSQPFSYSPINTVDGHKLLISCSDFMLEVPIQQDIHRISPADYFYVNNVTPYEEWVRRGFIRVIDGSNWILSSGFWNDSGYWDDTALWLD